jgi:hypothetical protein
MFTGLLIAMLIIAGAATVVGGGLMLASQRRRLPEPQAPRLLPSARGGERGLRELRVGDVIQYGGADYLVEGVLVYDEDGHRWNAGRLIDGREERWLIAGMERTGTGRTRVVQRVPDLELAGYPPETLVTGGVRYVLDKRGTATAKIYGDAGEVGEQRGSPDSVLRCRWWRYESAGDDTLVVEQWGDTYRALAGRIAGSSDIEMIPGS